MINTASLQNLHSFCARLLERCGNRLSSDVTLTFLAATKMATLYSTGVSLDSIRLTWPELFARSHKLRTLSAYWLTGSPPPSHELSQVLSLLKFLRARQVGSEIIKKVLGEMFLTAHDVHQSLPSSRMQDISP